MNAQEYAAVIKIVSGKLNIQSPDNTLIRNVSSYIKRLDLNRLKSIYPQKDELFANIAQSYIQSITVQEQFDFSKHLQKKKDASEDLQIINPLTTWANNNIPVVSSKSMSVYIDSRLRNVSESSSTDFSFTLVPRHTRSDIGEGQIQVRVMPSQVTYFKVGSIILPYASDMRARNFTKEITLTFTALRSNGIIGQNDTYHFNFTYSAINNKLVELTPVNNYCKFSPPLRLVDDLTLRFNDPIYPISFLVDRMQPSQFNYQSSDGRIVFQNNHNLEDGDVIIIAGLKTNNDSANSRLLELINNPRGVLVTKINNNTIATGIDFSQIILPNIESLPTILFYSNMFRFPIEIGYQDISVL